MTYTQEGLDQLISKSEMLEASIRMAAQRMDSSKDASTIVEAAAEIIRLNNDWESNEREIVFYREGLRLELFMLKAHAG